MKKTSLIIFLVLTLSAFSVAQTQETRFGRVTRTKESEQSKVTPTPTPIPTPKKQTAKANTGSESNARKGGNPSPTPTPTPPGNNVKLIPRPTHTPNRENVVPIPTPTPKINPTPSPSPTPVIKKVADPTPTPVTDHTPVWQKYATDAEVRSHNVLTIGNNIVTSYQKNNEHVAEDTLKASGCPDTDLRCTYLASYLVKKSLNPTTRRFADKQVNKFIDRFNKREAPKTIGLTCMNCETDLRNLQVAVSISIALDPNSKRSKKLMNQLGYLYTMRFVDTDGKTIREPNLLSASECLLSGDDEKTFQVVRLQKNYKIAEIK